MQKQVLWEVCRAAVQRRMRRTVCRAAVQRRMHRAVCCVLVLALVLMLCGDMVLPEPRQLLPELDAVERQLRALTADAPDGDAPDGDAPDGDAPDSDAPDDWRYSLRIAPGPGGTALIADAARRDAAGAWETIHTLWLPEDGAWRMVGQTRQKQAPMPGAQEERK